MRCVVVGLGVQGRKRVAVAGDDVVATVDPVAEDARYRALGDVALETYDAALVCTPDDAKLPLLRTLLAAGKHVLVEKPLLGTDDELAELDHLSRAHHAVCYTAYNHRFEPHLARLRQVLEQGSLGRIYRLRLFYGNGTARDVRSSAWRDTGAGVLTDLGSHLLDLLLFLVGSIPDDLAVWAAHRFENRALDHVVCGSAGVPLVELEMSLLSWRNHFSAEVVGERGSATIDSLCKWGPSTLTVRQRVLPSGRPPEESLTLVESDPTWQAEYEHFGKLCAAGEGGNLDDGRVLNAALRRLATGAQAPG